MSNILAIIGTIVNGCICGFFLKSSHNRLSKTISSTLLKAIYVLEVTISVIWMLVILNNNNFLQHGVILTNSYFILVAAIIFCISKYREPFLNR